MLYFAFVPSLSSSSSGVAARANVCHRIYLSLLCRRRARQMFEHAKYLHRMSAWAAKPHVYGDFSARIMVMLVRHTLPARIWVRNSKHFIHLLHQFEFEAVVHFNFTYFDTLLSFWSHVHRMMYAGRWMQIARVCACVCVWAKPPASKAVSHLHISQIEHL